MKDEKMNEVELAIYVAIGSIAYLFMAGIAAKRKLYAIKDRYL
jgi:hypothetical protein